MSLSAGWLPQHQQELGSNAGALLFIPAAPPPRNQHAAMKRAAQGASLLTSVLNVRGTCGVDADASPMSPSGAAAAGHVPSAGSGAGSGAPTQGRVDQYAAAKDLLCNLELELGMSKRQAEQLAPRALRSTPVGHLVGSATGKSSAQHLRPSHTTNVTRHAPPRLVVRPVSQQAHAFAAAASVTAAVASRAVEGGEDGAELSGCSTDNDEVDDGETASDVSAPGHPAASAHAPLERSSSGTYLQPWLLGGHATPALCHSISVMALQATSSILQRKAPLQVGASPGPTGPLAGRPPKPPGAPSSPSAAAAAAQAGQGVLAAWGGDPVPRARTPSGSGAGSAGTKLSQEALSRLGGGQKRSSRPGTASSFWSNYDLEEGALERAAAAAAAGEVKEQRPKVKKVVGAGSLVRSSSVGRPRAGLATPSKRPEPYVRVLHPAVIMDLALITPVPKPVSEVPVDEKGRPYPYVLPPTFPGAYPTIAFLGPAEHKQASGLSPLLRVRMAVRYAGIANSPVKAAFKEAGWRVVKGKAWNVCWGHIFSAAEFAGLHEFQRVNHFPGTWELGRKDHLYRNVAALRRKKGEALDIVPRFFVMPRDYDEFKADLERNPDRLYIQKPVNSSRGRGVRMVLKPAELSRDVKDVLVQHYIDNPYTINGYKFDMRIYVAVTSFDPLRCYVYHDGLARFATEPYSDDKADLKKRCVHLTNYSVNKKSNKFVANSSTEEESAGSKWSLSALRTHVEGERGPAAWSSVWRQVHNIIAGAVIAAEPRINTEVKMKVPHRNMCFEVWGFDIMLDDALRAWLIEVNTCPALAADSPLDRRVKNGMIADVMNLVGPVPYDPDAYEVAKEVARQSRLTGLAPDGTRAGPRTGSATCTGSGPTAGVAAARGVGKSVVPGAGGVLSAARAPPQVPRTIKEAEELDLRGLAPDQLPDIVVESEAEYARKRGWERVFPAEKDPCRYLELFDTPRASNIVLCKYYAEKVGRAYDPGRGSALVPTPSSSARPSRPTINDWRPGGMA